jgi:hypothetical protein
VLSQQDLQQLEQICPADKVRGDACSCSSHHAGRIQGGCVVLGLAWARQQTRQLGKLRFCSYGGEIQGVIRGKT